MFRIFSQYVSVKTLLLMSLEGLLVGLSLLCAVKLRFWNDSSEFAFYIAYPDFIVQSAIVIIVCVTCFYYNDLYDLSSESASVSRILRVEQSVGAACLLLGLLYFLVPGLLMSRGVFVIGMVLVMGSVVIHRRFLDKAWQLTAPEQQVLILGTGPLAVQIAHELRRRPDLSLRMRGYISAGEAGEGNGFDLPVLGTADELEDVVNRHGISRIIVALDEQDQALPARALVKLRVRGVRVDDGPSALSALTGRIALATVKTTWFLFSNGFHRSKWNAFLKRVLDVTVGMVGLILSTPLMLAVACIIRLESRGPVIYKQTRVGFMGKPFEVLKFRSMRADAERACGPQWASSNDSRVTRVGRILRKYRLDEMPQFINILKGDMSFVGPRPERPVFVEELSSAIAFYDERHSVRPGLTGWAQVQYTYGGSIEGTLNKLEYDLFYLKNMSLTFDMAIIMKTIRIVVGGIGAQ
jgi:sugar transferase (PEP-CTERM system associated)